MWSESVTFLPWEDDKRCSFMVGAFGEWQSFSRLGITKAVVTRSQGWNNTEVI